MNSNIVVSDIKKKLNQNKLPSEQYSFVTLLLLEVKKKETSESQYLSNIKRIESNRSSSEQNSVNQKKKKKKQYNQNIITGQNTQAEHRHPGGQK